MAKTSRRSGAGRDEQPIWQPIAVVGTLPSVAAESRPCSAQGTTYAPDRTEQTPILPEVVGHGCFPWFKEDYLSPWR
jgi:hypothetical protein